MSRIPTRDQCIELLKKSGCSDSVISHCKVVRDLALNIAKRTDADLKLVEAGALLHDIGRSKTHGLKHAIEGAKIAKDMDLPDSIIQIIERHIGAGLSADIAKKIGIPPRDYIPLSLEEKIVCHSDNLINDSRRQDIKNEIEKAKKNGQIDYAERLIKLHKELSDICGIDLNLL